MNRAEILVDGAQLQDIVVELEPGNYPLEFQHVKSHAKSYVEYTFKVEGSRVLRTIAPAYTSLLDPGEPSHVYTLRVIQERSVKK